MLVSTDSMIRSVGHPIRHQSARLHKKAALGVTHGLHRPRPPTRPLRRVKNISGDGGALPGPITLDKSEADQISRSCSHVVQADNGGWSHHGFQDFADGQRWNGGLHPSWALTSQVSYKPNPSPFVSGSSAQSRFRLLSPGSNPPVLRFHGSSSLMRDRIHSEWITKRQ